MLLKIIVEGCPSVWQYSEMDDTIALRWLLSTVAFSMVAPFKHILCHAVV